MFAFSSVHKGYGQFLAKPRSESAAWPCRRIRRLPKSNEDLDVSGVRSSGSTVTVRGLTFPAVAAKSELMRRQQSSANKRRNRWTIALSFGVALTLCAPALIAEVLVAVVDTQRVVVESEDGLRMQADLKKVFEQRQRELDELQNQLQQERGQLEKQRAVLAPKVLAERAKAWQDEALKVQQMYVEFNRELQKRQNEMTQPILKRAVAVIKAVAEADGYSLIVDKQSVPYSRAGLDITGRVISIYNNGGTVKAKRPALKK